MGSMINYVVSSLVIVSMTLPMSALRVTINGKSTGLPRLSPTIHQPIKLPVWPVWSGVIAQCFDWIKAPQISESIISSVGGRVVPITLHNLDVSPFLLLAHHSHSFTPLDPVRALTKLFLPEGFPAHPHSGFDTVTYAIDGGLRHRDSEGIKMSYADGDVQWMRAGRGVIHEEMWDLRESDWGHKRIEIFQLWVNLPKKSKNLEPSLHLLKSQDIPRVACGGGVSVKVICGTLVDHLNPVIPIIKDALQITSSVEENGREKENIITEIKSSTSGIMGPGSAVSKSPVGILHLTMEKPKSSVDLNVEESCTMTVYVRRGSLVLTDKEQKETEIRAGDVVVFRNGVPTGGSQRGSGGGGGGDDNQGVVTLSAGSVGLDCLLLCGKPLNEPVIWQGPLVMADEGSFRDSAETFNSIRGEGYWDHKISDAEWDKHTADLDLQNIISAREGLRN